MYGGPEYWLVFEFVEEINFEYTKAEVIESSLIVIVKVSVVLVPDVAYVISLAVVFTPWPLSRLTEKPCSI